MYYPIFLACYAGKVVTHIDHNIYSLGQLLLLQEKNRK